MHHCELSVSGFSEHTHQLLSGFILLERLGQISLKLHWNNPTLPTPPSRAFVAARFDGRQIGFDLDDGDILPSALVDEFTSKNLLLFRRSMSISPDVTYQTLEKHRPLGLNYHATVYHPFLAKSCFLGNATWQSGARSLGRVERDHYKRYEGLPDGGTSRSILFYSRLWEPTGEPFETFTASEAGVVRRRKMNDLRVDILRLGRAMFGSRFVGGLSPTPYALREYPELVATERETRSRVYIASMKKSAICITTRGLQESNGWKLGEYVAAARCIVAESPKHIVPGFEKDINYRSFENADQCMQSVAELMNSDDYRTAISIANRDYYLNHLKPDQLARRCLAVVDSL